MKASIWLQKTVSEFENAGILSPRADAEWLLCEVLNLTPPELRLTQNNKLTEIHLEKLTASAARRINREPLQYIIGTAPFCELVLRTKPGVLIPREDTVAVAELAQKSLEPDKPCNILDICCGSGAIGLLLATRNPTCRITFTDISEAAIACCLENIALLNLQSRCQCLQGDLFQAVPSQKFDIIVCNPPYITTNGIPSLPPEIKTFEPRKALDGGPDGLAFYRRMSREAKNRLNKNGCLVLEIGDGMGDAVCKLFQENGWQYSGSGHDIIGLQRTLGFLPGEE